MEAEGESSYFPDAINFWAEYGERMIAEEVVPAHNLFWKTKRLRVAYRPYELVGVIAPWNFPMILSAGDGLPALFAGSALMLKPSEVTPLAVGELVRGFVEDVGAPPVVEVVNGRGETGAAVVDECDYIQFTGSNATGSKVMQRAAESLTPVSLELGGKDAMIVTADADLERAANCAAWGGFINSGQVCMSIERIYVEEPAYGEFVGKLSAKVRSLRQGADGTSIEHDVGAMTFPPQVEKVTKHVDDALAAGARALTGGRASSLDGDFFEPTVLVDVDHSMDVMREETFGPVVGVMAVADVEEAIEKANDSHDGLSASVFAGDVKRGEQIARRLNVGAVDVNDALIHFLTVDIPMGGWKQSGIGYRHGSYGIRKFVRIKSIVSPRFPTMSNELNWYPYSNAKSRFGARILRFLGARDIRRRLGL